MLKQDQDYYGLTLVLPLVITSGARVGHHLLLLLYPKTNKNIRTYYKIQTERATDTFACYTLYNMYAIQTFIYSSIIDMSKE